MVSLALDLVSVDLSLLRILLRSRAVRCIFAIWTFLRVFCLRPEAFGIRHLLELFVAI